MGHSHIVHHLPECLPREGLGGEEVSREGSPPGLLAPGSSPRSSPTHDCVSQSGEDNAVVSVVECRFTLCSLTLFLAINVYSERKVGLAVRGGEGGRQHCHHQTNTAITTEYTGYRIQNITYTEYRIHRI